MEEFLPKIKERYAKKMPKVEKKIASYIIDNPTALEKTNIKELAKAIHCSEASVVRFARRLGFSGYQAMRIGIAGELRSISRLSAEMLPEDSCFDIFRKRRNDIFFTLQNTEDSLNPADLEKAAEMIRQSKRVVFFGLGNSASVAADAAHKFLRMGRVVAQSCSDNHMQAIIAAHLQPGDVAVGISHSGRSRDIVEALTLAHDCGAGTIALTNRQTPHPPLAAVADITLYTRAEETRHSILAMSSRIAQLAIFDAIYTYIVLREPEAAGQAVGGTEIALLDKKIPEPPKQRRPRRDLPAQDAPAPAVAAGGTENASPDKKVSEPSTPLNQQQISQDQDVSAPVVAAGGTENASPDKKVSEPSKRRKKQRVSHDQDVPAQSSDSTSEPSPAPAE